MVKNNRKGKAAIWTDLAIKKMRLNLPNNWHRLIFEIGLHTGERIGAIIQLKVSDIYDPQGNVLDTITFAGSTRKSSVHGQAATRQIFIHEDLKFHLENYQPPQDGYLFPSRSKCGHITRKAIDKCWRGIFKQCGLVGYSTHSSRHYIINKLDDAGFNGTTIADALCIDPGTVRSYLRYKGDRAKKAIASIKIAA